MNNFKKNLYDFLLRPAISKHLKNNFIQLKESNIRNIEESLVKDYFSKWPAKYLQTKPGQISLKEHLIDSVEKNRNLFIPWLDAFCRLERSKILEVGCGTGCSTIALAEQGAIVTGIDIDQGALLVARDRFQNYQLEATILCMNANELSKHFLKNEFDIIIFFASLEHMTYTERINSLKEAWDLLPPGGLLCIVETPNRLWYVDYHTSGLPFFDWLPDEIAFTYSTHSEREDFREAVSNDHHSSSLFRWGRGVSYHEFECALGSVEQLNVVSSLFPYYRRKNILKLTKWIFSRERRYSRFLKKINPKIPSAFFGKSLDLIIKKIDYNQSPYSP